MALPNPGVRTTDYLPKPDDDTGLCLLSLDGGGVRGLSTLHILKGIMTRLNKQRSDNGEPPLKPCELFDLIGGTSTGGHVQWPILLAAHSVLTHYSTQPYCHYARPARDGC